MLFWNKEEKNPIHKEWIQIRYNETELYIRLYGRLDRSLRNTLRNTLNPLLKHTIINEICLQMIDVYLLETNTAVALVTFIKDAEQYNVHVDIQGVSPTVKKVFEGLGVEELLNQ